MQIHIRTHANLFKKGVAKVVRTGTQGGHPAGTPDIRLQLQGLTSGQTLDRALPKPGGGGAWVHGHHNIPSARAANRLVLSKCAARRLRSQVRGGCAPTSRSQVPAEAFVAGLRQTRSDGRGGVPGLGSLSGLPASFCRSPVHSLFPLPDKAKVVSRRVGGRAVVTLSCLSSEPSPPKQAVA